MKYIRYFTMLFALSLLSTGYIFANSNINSDVGIDCVRFSSYCSEIHNKIRENLKWNYDSTENTETTSENFSTPVIFEITLLPNGAVTTLHMKQSSGNHAYDKAVFHAIRASSPFPLRPGTNTKKVQKLTILMRH